MKLTITTDEGKTILARDIGPGNWFGMLTKFKILDELEKVIQDQCVAEENEQEAKNEKIGLYDLD